MDSYSHRRGGDDRRGVMVAGVVMIGEGLYFEQKSALHYHVEQY